MHFSFFRRGNDPHTSNPRHDSALGSTEYRCGFIGPPFVVSPRNRRRASPLSGALAAHHGSIRSPYLINTSTDSRAQREPLRPCTWPGVAILRSIGNTLFIPLARWVKT